MSRKHSLAALRPLVAEHPQLALNELKQGHVQVVNSETKEITNWWPDSKKKTAHKQLPTGRITTGIKFATADLVLKMALEETKNA
jgi:hypothetical protein